jgi:hypothetical protein
VHVQRLILVVLLKSNVLLCILWSKGLNAKDIHEEMFLVYDGKCLSCKMVYNSVEKFSQGCLKLADDAQPGRPVEIATEATLWSGWKS